MPSSYTPLLRLTLPADGELVGTWGQTVNNGITSLEEAAIAGTANVALVDADYVMTTANGAADVARNATVRFTGVLSAQRSIIVPSSSKTYFIRNATTGGFGLNVKTAAGTGVVVPTGSAMLVYCDGVNVLDAVTSFGSVTISDINGVPDLILRASSVERMRITGATGRVGIGLAGVAAYTLLTVGNTDATAVISAGGLNTNLTLAGAGVNGGIVFNAGGVANGNVSTAERMRIDWRGNVGIGFVPADYGVGITTLQVNGATAAACDLYTGDVRRSLYTASATDVSFGTAPAIPLVFYTTNIERMRIGAAGAVSINTTLNPDFLNIGNGNISLFAGSLVSPKINWRASDSSIRMQISADTQTAGLGTDVFSFFAQYGFMSWNLGGVERMSLRNVAPLGDGACLSVGQAGPDFPASNIQAFSNNSYNAASDMTIALGSRNSGTVDNGNAAAWRLHTTGGAAGQILGTEAMIRGAGWRTIAYQSHTGYSATFSNSSGTNPDQQPFYVSSNRTIAYNGPVGGILADTYRDVANPHFAAGIWFEKHNIGNVTSSCDIIFGAQDSNGVGALPTPRMWLLADGKWGLNQAPSPSGHIIRQNGAWALIIQNNAGATQGHLMDMDATSASGNLISAFSRGGVVIGAVTQSGTTAVVYNTTSDRRLKTNIADLAGSGAFIDALQPRTWDWIAGGAGAGFVADEVAAVAPRMVHGAPDAVDDEGKPRHQMLSYSDSELIANMVAEIKSLRVRVAALEV